MEGKNRCGKKIDWVHSNENCIRPIGWRRGSLRQESDGGFKKISVLPFNQTILLRSVCTSNLVNNTLLWEVCFESIWGVFTATIRPKGLNFSRKLCFNHGFKMNKLIKNFKLRVEQKDPCKSSKMVNEQNIIFKAINRWNRSRTPQIIVNKLKRRWCNKERLRKW